MNPSQEERALEALYTTGLWLMDRGRLTDAIRVFQAMMVCKPTDERGWLALGTCHEQLENLDVAYAIFEAGRHAAGPGIRCEIARARLAHAMGNDDVADEAYAAAINKADETYDEELRELAMIEKEHGHVSL